MGQAAKKLEPKTQLLSISEIARRWGTNRMGAKSRLADLGFKPDKSSTPNNQLYRLDDEMLFSMRATRDDLSAARIRDVRASWQLKELKLERERGELVDQGEVVEIIQKIVSSIYQEFTVRQPKRVAARLVKAKNVSTVKKVLKTDTDRIMKILRGNFEKFI